MFIKTQSNTLLNLGRVTCLDVLKCWNENSATVKAKADGYDFDIYSGTIEEAEDAFHTIQEGLIHGASLIDYSK